MSSSKRLVALVMMLAGTVGAPAVAAPWAEAGDAQLRSDLMILNDAGMIRVLTTQWPIPWAGIAAGLDDPVLYTKPAYVREAARRVLARIKRETA